MTIERRYTHSFAARAAGDTGPLLRGHAAVFDTEIDMGAFIESIAPGAFTRTIAEDASEIVALWNHNSDFPLARLGYGLTLSEDATGLACEIDPDLETTTGRDVSRYVANKSVRGMSIGFFVGDQRIERRDGKVYRIITRAQLMDVSPVTYPAYKSTDIALRSALDVAPEILAALPADPPPEPVDWEGRIAVYHRRLTLAAIEF